MNIHGKNINYYENLFSQIQRGQNSYTKHKKLSPYKPIFILSVIELIATNKLLENKINPNSSNYFNLKETFQKYLKIIGGEYKNQTGVFHQPFENLRNDKHKETGEQFWHLELKDDYARIEDIKDAEGRNRIKTEAKLKELVEYGRFDDELWEILQDTESRHYLVDVIIDTFFADENNTQIYDIINTFNEDAKSQNQDVGNPQEANKKYRTTKFLVRDSIFRKSVIRLYDCQCAVCRLRMKIKPMGLSRYKYMVDAAHIIPFSVTYNNQLSNGISLCKNHHWAFDNGCFSLDNSYSIILSNKLSEECLTSLESLNTIPLQDYHGQKIFLPLQEKYYPNLEALRWHRQIHNL
ncbi:hypothetical protein HCG51_33390 [Tolypothrix sp. PCC 7910]|uniref:HNH endonuclease n=1 Tax=Tolypothrix sp. PCC 7910 TaxID=2099387 RepID=UPI0014279A32|nr:HNH endonuclease [Tolypothrix sp. PCC 7910]QIR41095.1 hypothetical protein HCG51_33390 [Tolypothrix sp. PCC 7910]